MSQTVKMSEIRAEWTKVRDFALEKYCDFEKIKPTELNPFVIIQQHTHLNLELLIAYINHQKKQPKIDPHFTSKLSQMMIWCLVQTFSAFEYYYKELLKIKEFHGMNDISDKLKKNKHTSIHTILKNMNENEYLNNEDFGKLVHYKEIRNTFVHNNAIFTEDKNILVDGIEYNFKSGKPLYLHIFDIMNMIQNFIELSYNHLEDILDLSRNYVFYKKQYKRLGNPRKKHQKT